MTTHAYDYKVAIWQDTVAPDDPATVAAAVEDLMNQLGKEGWQVYQANSTALANNIFRVTLYALRPATPPPARAEAQMQETQQPAADNADDGDDDEEPLGKPHGASRRKHK